MEKSKKVLKIFVFLSGLFEFLSALPPLFFTLWYREMAEMPPELDPLYLRQIGLFMFLVGGFIMLVLFEKETIRPYAVLALAFHTIMFFFESFYVFFMNMPKDLTYKSMLFFMAYHVIMFFILFFFMRKNKLGIFAAKST